MPTVPLGGAFNRRDDAFVPDGRMLNMFAERDTSGISPDGTLRVQRPGLSAVSTLGGGIRGMAYRPSANEEVIVSDGTLFGGGISKGAIGGAGYTPIAPTTFTTAIVGGTTLYLYDATVSALALPDGFAAQDVDQLNQYVLVLTSTGRFYWIVPGETTLDPLNFATAESSGDAGVALRRVNDEFWIFGTETTEVWQTTGDLDAPFQRVSGRLYERGCLSRDTVRRFDNTLVWVSNDGQVCRGGAVPQVISDNSIAERIRERTDALSAWTFGFDGHDFYVLHIPGQGTYVYDALTQAWCEFGSFGATGWAPRVGYTLNGETFCGGPDSGKVWQLDASNGLDDGQPIERIVTGAVALMGEVGRNDSLSVGVGSSGDTTIRLRWRDGQDSFPNYYDELDVRAPFDVASLYRLGLPIEPYRQVEFSCIAPERIRLAGCTVNQSWR